MAKSILIVDDSDSVREILKLTLQFKGYQIHQAINGKEGFEMLRETPVDMVITDLAMPIMTGIELLEKIRAEDEYKDLPILMCTAEDIGAGDEILSKGASRILKKPVAPKDLLEVVDELIG